MMTLYSVKQLVLMILVATGYSETKAIRLRHGGPYYANVGEPVKLHCSWGKLSDENGNLNKQLGWEKYNGYTQKYTQKFVFVVSQGTIRKLHPDQAGQLTIHENSFDVEFTPELDDGGQYRCFYKNLPATGVSDSTNLFVLIRPAITFEAPEEVVVPGQAVVTCKVKQTFPNVYINLNKVGDNSKPIFGKQTNDSTFAADNEMMVEFTQRTSTEETYECMVTWLRAEGNKVYRRYTTIRLLFPVYTEVKMIQPHVLEGNVLSGNPPIGSTMWYLRGYPINNTERFRMSKNGSVLTILKPSVETEGEYVYLIDNGTPGAECKTSYYVFDKAVTTIASENHSTRIYEMVIVGAVISLGLIVCLIVTVCYFKYHANTAGVAEGKFPETDSKSRERLDTEPTMSPNPGPSDNVGDISPPPHILSGSLRESVYYSTARDYEEIPDMPHEENYAEAKLDAGPIDAGPYCFSHLNDDKYTRVGPRDYEQPYSFTPAYGRSSDYLKPTGENSNESV